MPAMTMHDSFVAAVREFQAQDAAPPGHVRGLAADDIEDPRQFAEYVDQLCAEPLEETSRPPGYVPQTTLWWCASHTEFLGRLSIRHSLTPALEYQGGHIGYDVRPSARRKGHATAMLKAALPVARMLDIERALITCDADNVASRKVIEKNGGEFIDQTDGISRFWVPTG
jgi:predicted acetyltransferase